MTTLGKSASTPEIRNARTTFRPLTIFETWPSWCVVRVTSASGSYVRPWRIRNGLGVSTQSWVLLTNALKCHADSRIRFATRPSSRSTSSGNHAMNPSPVHWINSPPTAWIASDETQWRRGRNASMSSARSSLLM